MYKINYRTNKLQDKTYKIEDYVVSMNKRINIIKDTSNIAKDNTFTIIKHIHSKLDTIQNTNKQIIRMLANYSSMLDKQREMKISPSDKNKSNKKPKTA